MTSDKITVSRELLRQVLDTISLPQAGIRTKEAVKALRAALAEPAVQEPRNHVGNSSFESWYADYDPIGKGDKQRARDAYAAGMGDPVYLPAPVQEQQPVAWVEGRWYEDGTRAGNTLVWASRTAEDDFPVGTNLYTAQPRKAVKLSDYDVGRLTVFDGLHHVETPLLAEFIRAIEQAVWAKLGVIGPERPFDDDVWQPLYTAPQPAKQESVPLLTDEEVSHIAVANAIEFHEFARAIEAAVRQKAGIK